MSRFRIALFACTLIALPANLLYAQSTPALAPAPTLTIHARNVVENVVVMDRSGHAVPNLRKQDFQVFENGKQQAITFFESNSAATEPVVSSPAALPPDTFTNVPAVPPTNVTDVLLLDALNTRSTEEMYAQVEMVKYLASLPPNLRIGVFLLTDKLHVIWGFDQDSTALRKAIARFSSKPSSSSSAPPISAQKQAMVQAVADVKQTAAETHNTQLGQSADVLQDFLKKGTHWFDLDPHDRPVYTMRALQTLAHYLAGIPGRKNLFWIVDDFPLSNGCTYAYLCSETRDMLAEAGVSVYPIDANGVDANINPLAPLRFIDTGSWAKATGGKAYHENDIRQEIADAVEHGSRYYTLAYVPSTHKEEGRERKIEIKVSSGDYKLFYRRSYIDQSQREIAKTGADPALNPLAALMGRDMPNIAEMPYRLKVTPAAVQPHSGALRAGENAQLTGKLTRYDVAFQLLPGGFSSLSPDASGARRESLEIMLLIYGQDAKPPNWESHTIAILVKPEKWNGIRTHGLSFHFQIDAPDGDVHLCTGIYDAAHGKVGTLQVPLSSIALAQK